MDGGYAQFWVSVVLRRLLVLLLLMKDPTVDQRHERVVPDRHCDGCCSLSSLSTMVSVLLVRLVWYRRAFSGVLLTQNRRLH